MKVYDSAECFSGNEKIALAKIMNHQLEPEHTHTFVELVYIRSGSGNHQVNGQSYTVQRGDLLMMNVGDCHSFQVDRDLEYMNILFEPDFLSEQLSAVDSARNFMSLKLFQEFHGNLENETPMVKFRGKRMIEVEELLENMCREYVEKKCGYQAMLTGYVTLLLAMTFRTMQDYLKNSGLRDAYHMLPKMLTYIERHYAGQITLQDLAKQSFYSPYYISKIFTECLGYTFTEYVQQIRLQEAKRKLMETEDTVESIGRSVGYADKTQFFRLFKQSFGMTPQQLRKTGYKFK